MNQVNRPTTLTQLMSTYLSHNQHLASATLWWTKKSFTDLIASAGDITPETIGVAEIEDLREKILARGRAVSTANIYLRTLRPVFRWAQRRGWCGDPFAEVRPLKVAKKRNRTFELAEIASILNAAPNERWHLRLLLAITTGMRRGEILNLTVADIDFEKSRVYVQAKAESPTTWQWQPKDKDLRCLPLIEQVANCMLKVLDILPAGVPYLCIDTERYCYLMNRKPLPENIRICPENNFNRTFAKILRLAGVKAKTFHDLRRTCITLWLTSGIQPHEAMELAGHSSVDTTLRYYSAIRESIYEKAAKVSALALTKGQP